MRRSNASVVSPPRTSSRSGRFRKPSRQAAEARASLRSARAAVGAYGVQTPTDDADGATSSSFVLSSPVNGAVIERAAVIGQMLDPATPAFRIGELSTLWLTVHAFERDAVRIEKGVAARLAFPALPGQNFRGAVAVVGRHVERESRTVPVRIDVRNAGNLLRPGMSATAALPVGGSGDPILTRAGRGRATRPERMVRLPAEGREHLRDSTHRSWPRSRRGSGSAVRAPCRRERSSSMAPSCSRPRPRSGEGDHDEH